MRRLNTEDIYLLSEIADKMDIQAPEIKGKSQEQAGADFMIQLFRKMHKAAPEISRLISKVTGKEADQLSLVEIKDTLMEILKQDGVLTFFKQADTTG